MNNISKDTTILDVIKYNMKSNDFDVCACGGVYYISESDYYPFRCLGCSNLFCNRNTQMPDKAPDDIKRMHQELSKRCLFILCGGDRCYNGYCNKCSNNKIAPMPGCEKCEVVWCCFDHMTCTC